MSTIFSPNYFDFSSEDSSISLHYNGGYAAPFTKCGADPGLIGEMFKYKRTDADSWPIVEKRHHQEPFNSKQAIGFICKNRVG